MDGSIDAPAPQLTGELVRLLDGSLRVEDFVATMVHEAAQPLTAIQVLVTALREQGDALTAEERDRLLADIEGQARFLADLSMWMLDPFARETVQFDELVRGTVESCHAVAPQHDCRQQLEAAGALVDCETVRVQASVRNLVKNAAAHSPEGSEIVIGTRVEDGFAIVSVSDRGSGIPEDDWREIFKPYVRLGCPDEMKAPGSGLGLFVVHSCARQHDGFAHVASSSPAGTTIELALPTVT